MRRWSLKLNYIVVYEKSSQNKNADACSRNELNMNHSKEKPIDQFLEDFNNGLKSTTVPKISIILMDINYIFAQLNELDEIENIEDNIAAVHTDLENLI